MSYGCALAFIYYLDVQLDFSIDQIIANYNGKLASVYQALAGDTSSDPFAVFLGLLQIKA